MKGQSGVEATLGSCPDWKVVQKRSAEMVGAGQSRSELEGAVVVRSAATQSPRPEEKAKHNVEYTWQLARRPETNHETRLELRLKDKMMWWMFCWLWTWRGRAEQQYFMAGQDC